MQGIMGENLFTIGKKQNKNEQNSQAGHRVTEFLEKDIISW